MQMLGFIGGFMANIRTSVSGLGYGSVYIDSLIWGKTAWDAASGPITYYFGQTAADLATASAANQHEAVELDAAGLNSWSAAENNAFQYALSLFSSVCQLTFAPVASAESADIVWWKTGLGDYVLGMHETPAEGQIWGYFNPDIPSYWGNLQPGGGGLTTIIHELGHALGLAHPHDGGGEPNATTFPGIPWWETGDRGLSQGIWSVMSYNDGYDGAAQSPLFGGQAGLGAFDIAALQALYGANMSTQTGDDIYELPVVNTVGTGWSCIWDADGIDTISGVQSSQSVVIDLRAATLATGAAGAGGFVSQAGVIGGGFTIANGALIENATGGRGNDRLIGNSSANVLNGGRGADRMEGREGNDTYYVNTAKDIVADTSGVDTVYTSVSYALQSAARIEVLSATNTTAKQPIKLTGSASANTLAGNAGSNVLNGKGGHDTLIGGEGRDAFVFDTPLNRRSNVDRILDFSVRDDTLRLDHRVFKEFEEPGFLSSAAFHITTSPRWAHDADDRIIYNRKTGYIAYDPDGTGETAAVIFARLEKGLRLKASDFYIV
jgi:serralysin